MNRNPTIRAQLPKRIRATAAPLRCARADEVNDGRFLREITTGIVHVPSPCLSAEMSPPYKNASRQILALHCHLRRLRRLHRLLRVDHYGLPGFDALRNDSPQHRARRRLHIERLAWPDARWHDDLHRARIRPNALSWRGGEGEKNRGVMYTV